MATPARSLRMKQAFAATSPKTPPVRNLHITGAQNQPSSFLAFQSRVAELGRKTEKTPPPPSSRPFNTHRALKARGDSSPIDLCYFPQREAPRTLEPELGRVPLIPLLPSSTRPDIEELQHGEPVVDITQISINQIATSSGVGLEEGTVAMMGQSDGVDSAGTAQASADTLAAEARGVWNGFMDDLLGPRRA